MYSDAGGTHSVRYTSLVLLLINAVKEQQLQIEVAKKDNVVFHKENEDLKKRLAAIEEALKLYK